MTKRTVTIDTSDPETKAIWDCAARAVAEVKRMQTWKGGGGLGEQQERSVRCALEDAISMINYLHSVINIGEKLSSDGAADLESRIDIYRRALADWQGGRQ